MGLLSLGLLLLCGSTIADLQLTKKTFSDHEKESILESDNVDDAYTNFMTLYDDIIPPILMASTNPEQMRLKLQAQKKQFIKNLMVIKDHNKKYERGETGYKMTVNSFSIMSYHERRKYLGLRNVTGSLAAQNEVEDPLRLTSSGVAAPSSLDWANKGWTSSVKNQGGCGSCWTFPAIALLEFAYKRCTGKMIQLSEQELLDCTYDYKNYNGCGGGWYHQAWDWVIKNNHIAAMSDYRYTARDVRCSSTRYTNRLSGVMKLTGYIHVTPKDENKIREAMQIMPLAVAFTVEDAFFSVGGGVYDGCRYPRASNHAVTLTGYTSSYWEIKNSWGRDWGNRGYGRFRRRGDICNLLSSAYYIKYQDLNSSDGQEPDDKDKKDDDKKDDTCTDAHSGCSGYVQAGYCKKSFVEWMKTNCKKSCGHCTEKKDEEPPKPEPVDCSDANSKCPGWAGANYCNHVSYGTYMKTNCKKSCKFCSGGGGQTCVDKDSNCAGWSSYCKSNSYVKTNCKKTCRTCSGGDNNSCSGGTVRCSDGVCRHSHMCHYG